MSFRRSRRSIAAAAFAGIAQLAYAAEADDSYAQRLAVLVNQYRVAHQLAAFVVDAELINLGREHSAAMAKANQLNHDDFPARVRRSGRPLCVENVGWNYPWPEAQFDAWRASPGHDQNMLDPRVDRVGVAVVANYVTLIACGA
jgi:uncharacterized protein YkwD